MPSSVYTQRLLATRRTAFSLIVKLAVPACVPGIALLPSARAQAQTFTNEPSAQSMKNVTDVTGGLTPLLEDDVVLLKATEDGRMKDLLP